MNSLITEIKSGAVSKEDLSPEDLELVDAYEKVSTHDRGYIESIESYKADYMRRLPSVKKKFLDDGSMSSYSELKAEIKFLLGLEHDWLMRSGD